MLARGVCQTFAITSRFQGSPNLTAEHGLGLNPAAFTLVNLTVRRPGGQALDIGSGCGVQALSERRQAKAD